MRSRLVLLSAAVTTMVVIAFSLPLALLVRDLASDRAVGNAEREANALARTLVVLGEVDDATVGALIGGAGDEVRLAVVRADGQIVGDAAALTPAALAAFDGRSLLVDEDGGVASYVPVVGLAQPTAVRAWVGPEELRRNVAASWTVIAVLGLLLVGMAVFLADRLGRTLVRPVSDLAAATERLAAGDLDVAVTPSGPVELASVGAAFNRLVGRMRGLIESERESVADLSHRLRTPLTALRLNVESRADPEVVLDDIARIERTVDAVIEDARRPMRRAVQPRANLVEVVRARAAFWGPLADDQQRPMEVEVPAQVVSVAAGEADTAAVVDALLENVFAHTPDGSAVEVTVDGAGTLVVADRGPGFDSPDLVARGASGRGGTGLGLDIVRRTAEGTGGSLTIESRPEGGSRVVVRFGLAED